jgi:hypothetical protein
MARMVLVITVLIIASARAEDPKKALSAAPTMELRLADGSHFNAALLDETVSIQTPHGKLVVPLADVRRIDFSPRLPESVQKRIDGAIDDLGSTELAKREAADQTLLRIGPPAYSAVVRATKSPDRERAISAKKLHEQFNDAFAEQRLTGHDMDVIHTDDAKIAGRIEASTLRVRTPHFGEKTLKIANLASVRGAAATVVEEHVAQPDPGNLTNFAQQTGKTFHFTVTGSADGSVYGTDLYTTDSTLATAAVHAGLLRNGESGVVKVTIEPGAASYTSTTRNGVTSYDWGQYHASYKISRVKAAK